MLATLSKFGLLILTLSVLSACDIMKDEGADHEEETAQEEAAYVDTSEFNTEKVRIPSQLKGFYYAPGSGTGTRDAFILYANGSISRKVTFQKGKEHAVVIKGNGVVAKNEGPKVRVIFDGEELGVLQFTKKNETKEMKIPGQKVSGMLVLEFFNDFYDKDKKLDRNMEIVSVDVISR